MLFSISIALTVGTSSNNNLNEFDISRFSISSEAFVNLSEATINFVFTFYKESTLFPVDTNRNSTIATPILGAFIPNIDTSYLDSPAMIYFRLNKTMVRPHLNYNILCHLKLLSLCSVTSESFCNLLTLTHRMLQITLVCPGISILMVRK